MGIRAVALGSAVAAAMVVVAPVAAAQQAVPLRWVAMGDAFTAGGIDAAGQELLVGGRRDGCGRTSGAYPKLLADRLVGTYQVVDVSCAGASIANVVLDAQRPVGRHVPFFEVYDPDFPFPLVPRQIDAVTANTAVVSVGVGGNTLGFVELVQTCLQLGEWADPDTDSPCADFFTYGGDGVVTIAERLDAVADQYGAMLDQIRAAAPRATILAVGYPTIFPTDPATCAYGYTAAGMRAFAVTSRPDIAWLRTQVVERLNLVISQQALLHGARYVDVYTPTARHDVCRPDGLNWVEGMVDRQGRWAVVRPNTAGHLATANAVQAALPTSRSAKA
ncbi:hypothetical protein JOD54_004667 [Actinokineospora baliensis]|uniref:SGNH/GDSL hydrolase family protein n=1 Tax=Actinokineospora baliensis TaxID=547056 RepID=UPI00195A00E3|nr:SGNH/GDSL hydrolase family protein [Actinokineospora baliensis]MBM7774463.1 hypothetical protein [Actinokineospora baliensis]